LLRRPADHQIYLQASSRRSRRRTTDSVHRSLGAHAVVERIGILSGVDAEKVNRIIKDGHVATYLIARTGIVFQPTTLAM
jgi:hypothetical protein